MNSFEIGTMKLHTFNDFAKTFSMNTLTVTKKKPTKKTIWLEM